MANRTELDHQAFKLTENNLFPLEIREFIVGPTYPKRLYEFQKLYQQFKGDIDPYIDLPGETLVIYAVKVSSPNITDVLFTFQDIATIERKYVNS